MVDLNLEYVFYIRIYGIVIEYSGFYQVSPRKVFSHEVFSAMQKGTGTVATLLMIFIFTFADCTVRENAAV